MANTNPQVINFANSRIRQMADRMFSLHLESVAVLAEYNAGNIGTLISDVGAGEIISDGSATDGRTQITGGDIFNIMTAIQAYIAFINNGAVATLDRTSVITKPHVNRF